MKFGEKVRDLRKKNSLTQDELAKCLGVSKRTIIGWERDGRYGFFCYFSLARISSALMPSASNFFRTDSASAFFASSAALASAFALGILIHRLDIEISFTTHLFGKIQYIGIK